MCYGTHPDGTPQLVTLETLTVEVAGWPTTAATPDGTARVLKASRSMVLTSLVAYEQLTTAVLVSLIGVESALRLRLRAAGLESTDKRGRELAFNDLVSRAAHHGLVQRTPDEHGLDLWDYGRQLRNRFAHPETQPVLPYAAALPMIKQSHRLVADVFPG